MAEASGVTLCLEPLPPPECDFIRTTTEALDVIQAIDHPNLRLILDVKSMCGEQGLTGEPMPDIIRRVAPHVAHVQANDANLGYPGSGEVDFVPIFGALREVGYDDYVSVEVFDFTPGPETIARESIAYLRARPRAGRAPRGARAGAGRGSREHDRTARGAGQSGQPRPQRLPGVGAAAHPRRRRPGLPHDG